MEYTHKAKENDKNSPSKILLIIFLMMTFNCITQHTTHMYDTHML